MQKKYIRTLFGRQYFLNNTILWTWKINTTLYNLFNLFLPSVTFRIKSSHLICSGFKTGHQDCQSGALNIRPLLLYWLLLIVKDLCTQRVRAKTTFKICNFYFAQSLTRIVNLIAFYVTAHLFKLHYDIMQNMSHNNKI